MSLIVVKGRTMAADSYSFSNGVGYPVARPKITRLPDGSLLGCAGCTMAIEQVVAWAMAGMNPNAKIEIDDGEDDGVDWLWLKTDGSLRFGTHALRSCPATPPYAIGVDGAVHIAEGAMFAGASAEKAVKLAIKHHCIHVGGLVQVERL